MSEWMLYVAEIYLLIINIVGLALMGMDKKRAIKRVWRISERTFFLVAVLGGGTGCWLGMYVFRHKTRHWYFVVGIPFIFIAEFVLVCFLYHRFG